MRCSRSCQLVITCRPCRDLSFLNPVALDVRRKRCLTCLQAASSQWHLCASPGWHHRSNGCVTGRSSTSRRITSQTEACCRPGDRRRRDRNSSLACCFCTAFGGSWTASLSSSIIRTFSRYRNLACQKFLDRSPCLQSCLCIASVCFGWAQVCSCQKSNRFHSFVPMSARLFCRMVFAVTSGVDTLIASRNPRHQSWFSFSRLLENHSNYQDNLTKHLSEIQNLGQFETFPACSANLKKQEKFQLKYTLRNQYSIRKVSAVVLKLTYQEVG